MDAIFAEMEDGDGETGEHDEELKRLFDECQAAEAATAAGRASSDPARKKLKKQVHDDSQDVAVGKKRVAYDSAQANHASKRPLHMKKPQLKTPQQAYMERYKKLQAT